jgi:hypothetical protein
MTAEELGARFGGVLLVRLSSGASFTNDATRRKFDPSAPDDATIFENTTQWWWIDALVAQWQANAAETPRIVAGLAGPPARRYIAGAVEVDRGATWDHSNYPDFAVPALSTDIDVGELRGRLVTGATYNQVKTGHFMWVDRTGTVRHRPPRAPAKP